MAENSGHSETIGEIMVAMQEAWCIRVANSNPWIVYHPPGESVQARWFAALLDHYGEEVAPTIERRIQEYNRELPQPASRFGNAARWAFGRMDTADFTHVYTRGHQPLTLHIDEFVIGKVP